MIEAIIPALIVMGGLGLLLGLSLGIAAKKLAIQVDPRVEKMLEILPGANCGGCGFPGCSAYAEALAKGEAKPNLCAPGGPSVADKIGQVLGIEVETTIPKVARVRCRGQITEQKWKYIYQGIIECKSAALLAGGPILCRYGCLGFYDCVRACPFGAMKPRPDAPPEPDPEACTGCGICVNICPNNLITLIPKEKKVWIACASPLRGKEVKTVCAVGCIGCGKCAKVCEPKAIELKNHLPVIDYEKCNGCGACVEACPTKSMLS